MRSPTRRDRSRSSCRRPRAGRWMWSPGSSAIISPPPSAKPWSSTIAPAPATRSAPKKRRRRSPTATRFSIRARAGWCSPRCCRRMPATTRSPATIRSRWWRRARTSSVPVGSVQELVAYAKANPGKVNFSSGGIGVLPHLIGEWFKSAAAIDIVHVPYRGGGPSINDLVAGQVQMTFEGTSVLLPLIQSGKLRALATTSSKRIPELPDLPTMVESGFPGFVSTSWTGLLAPARTPREVIERLNGQVNEGLKSAELKSALAKLSNQPLGGTPQDFTDLIKSDIGKWAPIVKALGLKAY